jgi:hypothetical protein
VASADSRKLAKMQVMITGAATTTRAAAPPPATIA